MIGRRVATVSEIEQPGDYCGPIMGHHHSDPAQDRPSVLFIPPSGSRSRHRVASPPHVFRECADGSLEIRESIACGVSSGVYWHGYLDEGHVWREC